MNLLRQRRVVDAVHHDEQLVERERAAAAHAGDHELVDRALQPARRSPGRRAAGGAARIENSRSRHSRVSSSEVAVRRQRAVVPVEQVVVDRVVAVRAGSRRRATAAHADGVDLVDEDDALAAPLGREPLRLACEEADDHRIHADERLREAGARDRHERAVERRRDRLREHRLAGAGRTEEETPRSRLPPAFSKSSPDCQSETTRVISSFASAWPRTSSSLTPQSASPGS